MTKPLPWSGRFAALLLVPVGLLPLLFTGQRSFQHVPTPRFHDWTTRHVIYSQSGTSAALEAARTDPRALFRWREVEQRDSEQRQWRSYARFGRRPPHRFPVRSAVNMQRDWSISLGTAGTANAMYPAKFTFDVTVAPSCANDFVVFPVNAAGGAAQANIVAFNNLYSGNAGAIGICDGRANPPAGDTDTKTSATVMWAYNVHAIANGAVPTSPVLSLNGSKVAFVESATGGQAHFHVLAWKSNDGKGTNFQSTASPVTISAFSATAPAAGSGTATDQVLTTPLATGSDTLSSPYVDYANDVAYVGNDKGFVFRIKNVFCTTAACGTAAPSLDTTWGTQGAVSVCGGQLTAPVLDFYNNNVYVGCSDGKLYSISQSFAVKSLVVGDGVAAKAFGGIVDPPLVDGVNGFIYAVSGSANNGGNGVLVQAKADLSSSVAVPVGSGNQCNLHIPTPNNAYFTSPTAAGALMYVAGTTGTVGPCTATGATGGTAEIYAAKFGAGGVLAAGAPANKTTGLANPGNEFAPMIEFFNPHIGTGEDLLFFSVLCTGTDMAIYNITAGFPATTGSFLAGPVTEGFGTSGIVVDNSAITTAGNFPQAASFYFNALGENAACTGNTGGNTTPGTGGCAVKLTQAALQ
jgi:hypothetical protein